MINSNDSYSDIFFVIVIRVVHGPVLSMILTYFMLAQARPDPKSRPNVFSILFIFAID